MLKIGIDMDGVLADQVGGALGIISKNEGKRITRQDIDSWNAYDSGKIIVDMQHDEAFVMSMKPLRGAVDYMEWLSNRGYEIHIITSRHKGSDSWDEAWLSKCGIAYDYYHNAEKRGKFEFDVDVLVDDYHENIKEFVEHGGYGIIFQQPWNYNETSPLMDKYDKVYPAHGWPAVVGCIEQIKNKITRESNGL